MAVGAGSKALAPLAVGHRNNTVTQYHFGDRQDLIDAIYGYRVVRINDRRRELLKDLEADRDSYWYYNVRSSRFICVAAPSCSFLIYCRCG